MTKAAPEWTDARLNDMAAALQDVPRQLAVLSASVTHFEHLAAAKLLRRTRLDLVRPPTAELEVETRDLASYDTALGVEEGAH